MNDHDDPYSSNDSGPPGRPQPQHFPSLSAYSASPPQHANNKSASLLSSRPERRSRLVWWSFALAALLFTYAITERYAMTGNMPGLLPAASIDKLNGYMHPLFPNRSLDSNATHRTRVVLFICDGMRADAVTTLPALSAFLASLQPHVAVRLSLSQVPSVSV